MSSQFPINSSKPLVSLPTLNIGSVTPPPTPPEVVELQNMIEKVETATNRLPEVNQPSDSPLKNLKLVSSSNPLLPRPLLPSPLFSALQMKPAKLFDAKDMSIQNQNLSHQNSPQRTPTSKQTSSSTKLPLPNLPKMPSLFGALKIEELKRDWSSQDRPIKKAAPSQPRKITKGELESPFKKIYDDILTNGSFQYKKQDYKVSFLGKGNYSAVYSMEKTEYVLKCYHGEYRTGFNKSFLKGYLESSIQYYHTLKSLDLPVAEILNADTAATDHCIIQKRIANPINFSDSKQLIQVKAFFDAFCNKDVVMDLQPENFREENGVVYLIDFLEEEEEPAVRARTSLKAWANLFYEKGVSRIAAEQMLKDLGKTFIDSKKYITEDSIQEFLDN